MVLLAILITLAIFMLIGGILLIAAGGAVFSIVFADVIVCVLAITYVIRKIIKKRKKK